MIWSKRSSKYLGLYALFALAGGCAEASDFRFDRDTLAFANSTVFEYHEGYAQARTSGSAENAPRRYTRRCFVMSRTALQFYKFARFDPRGAALNDEELAARVRSVTHMHPWNDPLPKNQRVVFPGYASLRAMSKARGYLLQENIGLGWPTYARPGNTRMFLWQENINYQVTTHVNLDHAMARGDFFVAYLSDYPHFRINHSVLVYGRKPNRADGIERYVVYDPNHPDGPRELKWSPQLRVFNFQKDQEFPGGFTNVYQVYGKPLQ